MGRINHNFKIISNEQGRKLIAEGYSAIDPHCHSSYSYDVPDTKVTNPLNVVKYQKLRGLMPIITDHDNMNAYNYLKRKGTNVIPAVELTFKPKIAKYITGNTKPFHVLHINIFDLNQNDLLCLQEIANKGNLDELIKYLKDNDLEYMYNHPLFHDNHEKLNWKVIPSLAKNYFDVIELNSQFSKSMNDISLRLAHNLNKQIIASSDNHTGNPGGAYIVAEGKRFRDFWDNVKAGNAYIVRKDMGTLDIVKEASLMVNQAFTANTKPRVEKRFTPATNFKPFDSLATSVTSGSLKNKFILKKVLQMILQSVNYTAGPILAWRLHVRQDEKKAHYIKNKIHSWTNKLKKIEEEIKQKSEQRKLEHQYKKSKFKTKEIIKRTYNKIMKKRA
jgi:predicted metal-dependent phosphoesterase TrpH